MRENTKNTDERYGAGLNALMKGFQLGFVFLAFIIVFIIAGYLVFGGAFTVHPQENVLTLTFGKVDTENIYTEGWHWHWPYPIGNFVRIPMSNQRLTTSSFWYHEEDIGFENEDKEMTRAMMTKLDPGRDGYLMTGDANLIHAEWGILYKVSDPLAYYLNALCPEDPRSPDQVFEREEDAMMGTRGPRTVIRNLLENAVLHVTASTQAYDALYKEPFKYTQSVEKLFRRNIQEYDLGIDTARLEVNLIRKTAPEGEVRRAFDAVFSAEMESSTEREKALRYAIEKRQEAQSESEMLIVQAKAYRKLVVSTMEAQNLYFRSLLKQYRDKPESVLLSLYNDTLAEALENVSAKYIIHSASGGRQEVRIMINPEPAGRGKEPRENR